MKTIVCISQEDKFADNNKNKKAENMPDDVSLFTNNQYEYDDNKLDKVVKH